MSDVNYMSEEGLEKLKDELNKRKTEVRKDIANQIATAKEQGDLSENFEYQEAKDQQGENETRIIALQAMITNTVLIEQKSGGSNIALGTSFTTELENGSVKKFEIVGPTETDPIQGKISNESPLGKEFLGKSVGDTAEIEVPSGTMSYKITAIK